MSKKEYQIYSKAFVDGFKYGFKCGISTANPEKSLYKTLNKWVAKTCKEVHYD